MKCQRIRRKSERLIRHIKEFLVLTNFENNHTPHRNPLHRKSMEVLEVEIQKLQDERLCLEAQVREKENMLLMQEEEFDRQDEMRVQSMEELKAVASHWAGKWEKVALTLQLTQNELEELKRNGSANDVRIFQCMILKRVFCCPVFVSEQS